MKPYPHKNVLGIRVTRTGDGYCLLCVFFVRGRVEVHQACNSQLIGPRVDHLLSYDTTFASLWFARGDLVWCGCLCTALRLKGRFFLFAANVGLRRRVIVRIKKLAKVSLVSQLALGESFCTVKIVRTDYHASTKVCLYDFFRDQYTWTR